MIHSPFSTGMALTGSSSVGPCQIRLQLQILYNSCPFLNSLIGQWIYVTVRTKQYLRDSPRSVNWTGQATTNKCTDIVLEASFSVRSPGVHTHMLTFLPICMSTKRNTLPIRHGQLGWNQTSLSPRESWQWRRGQSVLISQEVSLMTLPVCCVNSF